MIAKVEVRKRLALYEQKIREEKKDIEAELDRMRNACATVEMKAIWNQSKEYAVLMAKWETLNEILMGIVNIRCDAMFDDD